MGTKIFRAFNKIVALVLSIVILVSIVWDKTVEVKATDASVTVEVSLKNSSSVDILGATVKLYQQGTDTEMATLVENAGVYSGTTTVDVDVEYYVEAVASGYSTVTTTPAILRDSDTNEISVVMNAVHSNINVIVTDDSGEDTPIEGATVRLYKKNEDTELLLGNTGETGTYSFDGSFVEGEEYYAVVSKEGYVTQQTSPLTLENGIPQFTVQLEDTKTISVVVNKDSSPVNDAIVTVKDSADNEISLGNLLEGVYSFPGGIVGEVYTVTVTKEDYVTQTQSYQVEDNDSNVILFEISHAKLSVSTTGGATLTLLHKNGEEFETVSNAVWTESVAGVHVTESVSIGETYKITVEKDDYVTVTSDEITIQDSLSNTLTVAQEEEGAISLSELVPGTVITLYKGSVEAENVLGTVRVDADGKADFAELVPGEYYVSQGLYRQSEKIDVIAGKTAERTKDELWVEYELSIVTIGTAPTIKYEDAEITQHTVSVLETSQSGLGQSLEIEAALGTNIVGLVVYDGSNYFDLLSGSIVEDTIALSDSTGFFGNKVTSDSSILYIITDKEIASDSITVQFGTDANVFSFEKSKLDVTIRGNFGNVAGAYNCVAAPQGLGPAVYAGDNDEFLKNTVLGTFTGGSINFINSNIGDYTYEFDFVCDISLKNASATVADDVLEELSAYVLPTASKEATVTITEVLIVVDGVNADVKVASGKNLILDPMDNMDKTYYTNGLELFVQTTGAHKFEEYSLNSGSTWSQLDSTGVITLADGNNTLLLQRNDGLRSEEYTFIVDTIVPEITGIVIDYIDYTNTPQNLKQDSDDNTTDIPEFGSELINSFGAVSITVNASDLGQEIKLVELIPVGNTTFAGSSFTGTDGTYEYTLSTTTGRIGYYIRVTDKAGNVTDSEIYTISIDTVAPTTLGANYSGLKLIDGVQYGGSNATVTVSFTDAHHNLNQNGVSVNGISSYSTEVSADGSTATVTLRLGAGTYNGITVGFADIAGRSSETVYLHKIIVDPNAPAINVSYTSSQGKVENGGMVFYRGPVTATVGVSDDALDESSIVSSFGTALTNGGTEIISADGTYAYSVSASDMSGNVGVSESSTFTIDSIAPVVTLSFDNNEVFNERFYNNGRVATFTVVDANFDAQVSVISVTSSGTLPNVSDWVSVGNNTYQATVTFNADADYTMAFACVDRAGNPSNTIEEQSFTIDKTAPVVEVTYDNYDVINGSYYGAVRTATITVTEHNFIEEAVNVELTASNGKQLLLSGWVSNGDVHTVQVAFEQDATYTIRVGYTDVANNVSAGYDLERFTVDTIMPELELFGIEDDSANNGVVQPGIRYSDVNLSSNIVIELVNSEGEIVDYAKTQTEDDGVIEVIYDDFEKINRVDDIYRLNVVITDMAGNTVSESITFSVNRFGSTYALDEETKAIRNCVVTQAIPISITEVNVDVLEEIKITYSLNGNIVELVENEDYTVVVSDKVGGGKEYAYVISEANFEAEGTYILTIYSKDKAGNVQDNKVKSVEGNETDITFIVDKTAPSIVVSGIEDGGQYTQDSKTITLDIQDNVGIKEVKVYVDGVEYVAFIKDDFETSYYGTVSFELAESTDRQAVRVIAVDEAGLVAQTHEEGDGIEVLVTSNTWVQFVNNTPLMIATIAGAVVVVGGGATGVVFKRRKRKMFRK